MACAAHEAGPPGGHVLGIWIWLLVGQLRIDAGQASFRRLVADLYWPILALLQIYTYEYLRILSSTRPRGWASLRGADRSSCHSGVCRPGTPLAKILPALTKNSLSHCKLT
jgi:hypothetical protein